MVNRTEPAPGAIQRMRYLSILILGAMIPLLINTVLDLLTTRPAPGHRAHWNDYASGVGMLVLGIATSIIAFRIARYSRLPGVPAILLLMAVVVGVVAVSHFL